MLLSTHTRLKVVWRHQVGGRIRGCCSFRRPSIPHPFLGCVLQPQERKCVLRDPCWEPTQQAQGGDRLPRARHAHKWPDTGKRGIFGEQTVARGCTRVCAVEPLPLGMSSALALTSSPKDHRWCAGSSRRSVTSDKNGTMGVAGSKTQTLTRLIDH